MLKFDADSIGLLQMLVLHVICFSLDFHQHLLNLRFAHGNLLIVWAF